MRKTADSTLTRRDQTGAPQTNAQRVPQGRRARDDRYVMMSRNDGSEAKLYDPQMDEDVAASNPGVAECLFDDYVLGDAGGPLPPG